MQRISTSIRAWGPLYIGIGPGGPRSRGAGYYTRAWGPLYKEIAYILV